MWNVSVVLTWANNPILRTVSKPIKKIDQNTRDFSIKLKDYMYEYDWVGLAAPQVWNNIRMIAITFWREKKWELEFISDEIMINPNIIKFSKNKEFDIEWCLSLPWIEKEVERSTEITVEYLNLEWEKIKKDLRWINARIIQHEVDHLDAILFIDRAKTTTWWLNIEKFIKN